MSTASQALDRTPTPVKHAFLTEQVRALIAEYLYVDPENVSDDARFAEELGADSLDCLELMIAIEDRFPGIEIRDDDLDQFVAVGDLIRYVDRANRSDV
jgi:acyl carrier protein